MYRLFHKIIAFSKITYNLLYYEIVELLQIILSDKQENNIIGIL